MSWTVNESKSRLTPSTVFGKTTNVDTITRYALVHERLWILRRVYTHRVFPNDCTRIVLIVYVHYVYNKNNNNTYGCTTDECIYIYIYIGSRLLLHYASDYTRLTHTYTLTHTYVYIV